MDMGPVMQDLGSFRKTDVGRARMLVVIPLCLVALAFFGMCALVVASMLMGSYGIGETISALLLYNLPGLIFVGFAVALAVGLSRPKATIHPHGITLQQVFFRTDQVLWRDIARIHIPGEFSRWATCAIELHTGRRIRADRLCLRSKRGPGGELIPHPDLQIVLLHLAAWRRAHGRAGS